MNSAFDLQKCELSDSTLPDKQSGGLHLGKPTSFQSLVSTLEDPRQQTKVLYPLDEILLLCFCGVVSGCDSFVDIVEYGTEKLKFLR
jgi:hypothetical protein